MGVLCDECEDGYWNMDGASGCQPCSCDAANALSYVCDKAGAREPRRLHDTSATRPSRGGVIFRAETRCHGGVAMCSGDGTVPVPL